MSAASSVEGHNASCRMDFVFAFGSLINAASRRKTHPNLKTALPVIVQNVERIWNGRISSVGFTAMGVRFRRGQECNGVLLEIRSKEILKDLDRREGGYVRLQVPIHNVQLYGKSLASQQQQQQQTSFQLSRVIRDASEDISNRKNVKIWIYVPKHPMTPTSSFPIPQSYVDIILQGCLEISEEFAQHFVATTAAWTNNERGSYVNDRQQPIYVRADLELSAAHGRALDQLLSVPFNDGGNTRTILDERVEYNAAGHLLALKGSGAPSSAMRKVKERIDPTAPGASGTKL